MVLKEREQRVERILPKSWERQQGGPVLTSNEMNHVNYFNIGGLLIYQIGDGANVNVINSITVEGTGVCLQHSSIPRKCAPAPI